MPTTRTPASGCVSNRSASAIARRSVPTITTGRTKRSALRWADSHARYTERQATSASQPVMHPRRMSSTWKYSLKKRSSTIVPSPITTTARVIRDSSMARTALNRLTHRPWLRITNRPKIVTTTIWPNSSNHEPGPTGATKLVTK